MNPKKQKSSSHRKSDNKSRKTDSNRIRIVGIGASAGGLEALEQFFQNMPNNSGLSFVVIQHLDPKHTGIMPELLQRMTTMPVSQAKDRIKAKANSVYVIPPNKSLSLLNGMLHLFDPVESHGLRLPIDIFFRSLAGDQQEKSIGIILSGMGSDGSLGLKAIKEINGVVIVQDPASAKFDGMPLSALESVVPDIVSPASEIPGKLLSFLKLKPATKPETEIEFKIMSNIEKIIILLREYTGHDFSLYKKSTLFRRIERRKDVHQIDKIQNYVRFLQENPAEIDILFKELLIGVTNFFRDNDVWDTLRDKILPKMIDKLPTGYVMRAWVAGCSTGEEAYTLAIVFKEVIAKLKKNKNISLQIFASDIDADAIEIARRGYFSKNIFNDVSPERIKQFFTIEGDGCQINTSLREMVVFATQNAIKDPPFIKLDILTCRNMMIYMETELQQKLISLFNYSLNPDGILVLGTAETLGKQNESFTELSSKYKIFKRTDAINTHNFVDFPTSNLQLKTVKSEKIRASTVENIQVVVDQIILQRYSPASVLVNNKGDILYITGRTGKYLEPVAGKANWNIFAMAREGLNSELPDALRRALKNFDPLVMRNIKIETSGGGQLINVTVQQIENPSSIRGLIIVVFSDVSNTHVQPLKSAKSSKGSSSIRQKEFEIELQKKNEELQSLREEMQTSQEELKSTNEELQSTNEELQSTNEELTTSKEEMQSLNEELQTVNIELQSKVNDYLKASDDMNNLLDSTEIATLFLDRDLNIRKFTDSVSKIFKIRKSDLGRPFTDLVSILQYPDIDRHAKNVIKTLISTETAITTVDNKWFSVRIMPYRTLDDHIDGLVMTFNDITVAKVLEFELKKANMALLGKGKNATSPDKMSED